MSTNWSVIFDKTLAEYVQEYSKAYGDIAVHAQVLKNCQEDIKKSPLHEEQVIDLLQLLCQVSISSH